MRKLPMLAGCQVAATGCGQLMLKAECGASEFSVDIDADKNNKTNRQPIDLRRPYLDFGLTMDLVALAMQPGWKEQAPNWHCADSSNVIARMRVLHAADPR